MDPCASSRPSGSVGIVALDLLRRVFAVGRPRRFRRNYRELKRLEGYGKPQSSEYTTISYSGCWNTVENDIYDCDDLLEEDEELLELTKNYDLRERQRSSISSNDSSKRWSSSDQHHHRRRKGFNCMRLRIVNMTKLMAMMRKVRVAYRRMMNAAAASKTMLSLSDLYNDIADLIPVPGSSSSKMRTIVVIRPIKCAVDGAEELPASSPASEPSLTSSRTYACETKGRRLHAVGHDVKSALVIPEAADHENFTCRKFPFPRFNRNFSMSSCTWKTSSRSTI